MKTRVLNSTDVEEIARIGELRKPNEACGILLPMEWRGRRVWEMPNRSPRPHDEFHMKGEDIAIEVGDWVEEFPEEARWEYIAIWHTHPGGNLGPSSTDVKNRISYCANLVVTLSDKGPKATWF